MPAPRIIVTGAGGFIGRWLSLALSQTGYQVVGCLRRPDESLAARIPVWQEGLPSPRFKQLVREFQPDWVLHCAGSSRVANSLANPAEDFRQTVELTDSIYEALALVAPLAKVIQFSSAAVYGQPAALPITEQTAIAPLSPYGWNKWRVEQLGAEWHQAAGIETLVLRIFSAYGPGLRKQVLYDLFCKARHNEVVELRGSGNEQRDFVHVRDLVRVVQWVIDRPFTGFDILNVASGTSTSIRDLAETFLRLVGWNGQLRFDGLAPPGMPQVWQVAPQRLAGLGLQPQIPLKTGLREYLSWLEQEGLQGDAHRILAAAG